MKVAVTTFPGSNCDDDCIYTLKKLGHAVTNLWHKDTRSLSEFDFVILSGGFSYGDYLRCGAIASVSPVMNSVKQYAEAGGLIMGICNGFQILCESHLLPGVLIRNASLKFICTDMPLKITTNDSPWTCDFKKDQTITIPMSHGDGRYILPEGQKSEVVPILSYVDNLNGSEDAIAGVCNKQKNIFGLMPHPERATDIQSKDGLHFWKSIETFVGAKNG